MSDGNLDIFSEPFTIEKNKGTSSAGVNIRFITSGFKAGLFEGNVPVQGKKPRPIHGVILENLAWGYGWFLGDGEVGNVDLYEDITIWGKP